MTSPSSRNEKVMFGFGVSILCTVIIISFIESTKSKEGYFIFITIGSLIALAIVLKIFHSLSNQQEIKAL